MATPIVIDVHHKLGREEAKRRMVGGLGKLPGYIPGRAEVKSHWTGDRLDLAVTTMGQTVDCKLDVFDKMVRVELVLPGILGMFAEPIARALRERGGKFLADERDDKPPSDRS